MTGVDVDVTLHPLHPVALAKDLLHLAVAADDVRLDVGGGGRGARGSMYVQTTPLPSTHGYVAAQTVSLNVLSAGSLGISTQRPVTSNFQPW